MITHTHTLTVADLGSLAYVRRTFMMAEVGAGGAATGRLLLAFNPTKKGRNPLAIAASTDNGVTFQEFTGPFLCHLCSSLHTAAEQDSA